MPELPEVEALRRELEPVMRGARIARVLLRRRHLRRAIPADFVSRVQGRTIRSVERRGKYLLARLSSGDTVLIHLGMSGSFRIDRPAKRRRSAADAAGPPADPHDHVVVTLSTGAVVTFNDPRRFGLIDLLRGDSTAGDRALQSMGPEPLEAAFDAAALARACAGKRSALKVALLDQRTVAGVGNIYASEALHRAGLSPRSRSSTIATAAGAPREAAFRLVAAIKAVLQEAINRTERAYRSGRFRVYGRDGQRCRRRGCGGTIRRISQAGRSTFYCPTCQPAKAGRLSREL
jgi:formamidopyrimidine-DNA glycosylase